MTFQSFAFVDLVVATFLLFHVAPVRARPSVLLLASALFYLAAGVAGYLALLVAASLIAFVGARAIERHRDTPRARLALIASLVAIVGTLLFFKVAEVAPASPIFRALPRAIGAVIVPIGLSYYVFKLASYLLDVYWETATAERDP
ncbi:MAG: hypothetical protein ACHREM_25865, partial [Polyangiales bacterium]